MALEAPNLVEYLTQAFAVEEQHQVLGFPRDVDSRTGFRYFTPKDLDRLTNSAAVHYIDQGLHVRKKGQKATVVGIWGPGTIEWVATFFAIILMGHTPLVISSKLSEDAAKTLIKQADGDVLIYSSVQLSGSALFERIAFVDADVLDATSNPTIETRCNSAIISKDDLAFIMHSSGSTGLPKLFENPHGRAINLVRSSVPWSPLTNRDWVSSAVYNTVGLRMLLLSPSKTQPLVYDNDRLPFASEGLVQILEEVRPNRAWMTTYSLEMIAAHPRGLENLARCDTVCHFGAVLPKELGDELVQHGTNLYTNYGMSEAGQLLTSEQRPEGDTDWDFMAPTERAKEHLLFRPIGVSGSGFSHSESELHELICLASYPGLNDSVEKSKDPPGSLHTGDLWLKHPAKEHRWRIVGRMDDQLKVYHEDRQVVINGFVYEEKIKRGNEDILDEVVLFGQGQPKLGVLIFAKTATDSAKQTVIERVWSSIDSEINQRMKVGIEKDMIVVMLGVSAQLLPRTTKMNFIRPQMYLMYEAEIDTAYKGSANGHVNGHTK